jgi:hypothetical protein
MAVMICDGRHVFKEFAQKVVAACVSGKEPVLYEQSGLTPFYVKLATVRRVYERWNAQEGRYKPYGEMTYGILIPLLKLATNSPAFGQRLPRGALISPHNDVRCFFAEPWLESGCFVTVYSMLLRPGDVFYAIKTSTWTHKNATASYVIDGDGVIRSIPAPRTLRVEQPVRMAA